MEISDNQGSVTKRGTLTLETLPMDLLMKLFNYLPLESLHKMCCVNQAYRNMCIVEDSLWERFAKPFQKFKDSWRNTVRDLCDGDAWLKKWSEQVGKSTSRIWNGMRPEMECVCIYGDKIFLGAKGPTLYAPNQTGGLFFLKRPFGKIFHRENGPEPACDDWNFGPVNDMDISDDLLAAACSGNTGSKDGFVVIFDPKNMSVVKHFVYANASVSQIDSTWQSNRVTCVKFAAGGSLLFASSPGDCDGVKLWNIESGLFITSFNHRIEGESRLEAALYGVRDKDEIHGLLPTEDGNMLLSASYRFLYQWDVKTQTMLRKVEFYPSVKGIADKDSFWMNQVSAYPLRMLGFSNPSKTIVTVVGTRKSKVQSYEWPSMEPAQLKNEFLLPVNEIECMHITPWRAVGADNYGTFYIWDSKLRGSARTICSKSTDCYSSGTNGIWIHPSTYAFAWSSSNPQSGWNGMIAGFSCIGPVVEDWILEETEITKQKKEKKCTIQ